MTARTRLLLPLVATCLLASCASTNDRVAAAPSGEVHMVNDAAYMAAVENLAVRNGVKVHWIHPPKVRATDD